MDKMEAHQKGILHRAFSVFIFNNSGEILLQQRAGSKYHGSRLWTNACCSHPQWNEEIRESALERLHYEMGFQCQIEKIFSFLYHTPVENNLIEHEFDHVFVGCSNQIPKPNKKEVQNFRWIVVEELQDNLKCNPNQYTYWFKQALPVLMDKLNTNKANINSREHRK